MDRCKVAREEDGIGFIESLIAITVAGIACVAFLSTAVMVMKEAKNNEYRDAMNYYAQVGFERVRSISVSDYDQLKGLCQSATKVGHLESGAIVVHEIGVEPCSVTAEVSYLPEEEKSWSFLDEIVGEVNAQLPYIPPGGEDPTLPGEEIPTDPCIGSCLEVPKGCGDMCRPCCADPANYAESPICQTYPLEFYQACSVRDTASCLGYCLNNTTQTCCMNYFDGCTLNCSEPLLGLCETYCDTHESESCCLEPEAPLAVVYTTNTCEQLDMPGNTSAGDTFYREIWAEDIGTDCNRIKITVKVGLLNDSGTPVRNFKSNIEFVGYVAE